MPKRRRRRRSRKISPLGWLWRALAAVPGLYLLAAVAGSLIPTNRGWTEPAAGTTVYLISNGIHADLVLPVKAQGLDWAPLLPARDFARLDPASRWIAFGAGERRVYLETPRWRDIRAGTLWAALSGGERVIHAQWTSDPTYEARAIRLRPEEYRRLWAAIRTGFLLDPHGRPQRIDHPGYGPEDAFYLGVGRTSAFTTCNSWVADRLRIAGVRTGAWTPFGQGLLWRYRPAEDQST